MRQQRLQYLKTILESARSCKILVTSPAWEAFKTRIKTQQDEVAIELVTLKIKPERMAVVAERSDSRIKLIEEIEFEANRLEALESRYDEFLKLHNSL